MLKNATPRQVAITATFIITGWIFLILIVASILQLVQFRLFDYVLILTTSVLVNYFVIISTLKRYIYRKIKLIYKSIHKVKVGAKQKAQEIDITKDIIGEVEREVTDWAENSNMEIQKLKALEAYRRNFLGDISHELKTPLFNIQGYILTLLDGGLYDKNINQTYLQKASTNIDRLQTIVEDLDAIARLESGASVLEIQEFDIRNLATEVLDDMDMIAQEKNIELKLKEGADQGFKVKADKEGIRQVLTNLITNSVKYGREKDGTTKVSFYDMENYILIEVADNGIGIDQENLNRVFDRFFRADKSRSRALGGSGLGLSIVKHIIEAHNQTINVRSSKGYGSTFGFTLEKA